MSPPPGSRGARMEAAALTFDCPTCGAFALSACVVVQRRPTRNGRPTASKSGQPTRTHCARWELGRATVQRDEAAGRCGGAP